MKCSSYNVDAYISYCTSIAEYEEKVSRNDIEVFPGKGWGHEFVMDKPYQGYAKKVEEVLNY